MSYTDEAVSELQAVLKSLAQQNTRLRMLAVGLVALLCAFATAVVLVTLTLADLRANDLRQVADARTATRVAAAEGDLRGCRHDEAQDRVLANLLLAALSLPPRRGDLSAEQQQLQTRLRERYRRLALRFQMGRNCAQINALKLIPIADRARLLRRFPPQDSG